MDLTADIVMQVLQTYQIGSWCVKGWKQIFKESIWNYLVL
jgi:hypothetical protein